MEALTDRQQQVLDFLTREYDAYGVPPSLNEVARELGVASRSTAHRHVVELERKGYVYARTVRGQTMYFPVELVG